MNVHQNDRRRSVLGLSRRQLRAGTCAAVLGITATLIASPAPRSASSTAHAGEHHWLQIGKASWYGKRFEGHKTATGERFDPNALTCAHRTLPLGSWLRVTNLRNHKWTFVRVNDRGPYVASAILDLSHAAAERLGIGGVARVRIEEITPADPQLAQALVAQLTAPLAPIEYNR